ncbi:MAG: HNH endonuclease [Bosea sp.]|uniref:HNH endonuclease n=1 Tax=Bosea sp. (in: a-proteobacteria) TaxID=1871050 RepID=UPI001AD0EE5A|nr:HNH endonuclease [Bosea sp. (in: a-proteobacteria)]MBN9450928.1 HNH endonuclease [Bosea sp. (in: a-proteobacteria)]
MLRLALSELEANESLIAQLKSSPRPASSAFSMVGLNQRHLPKSWGVDLRLSELIPLKAAYNYIQRYIKDEGLIYNSEFNTIEARKYFERHGFRCVEISRSDWAELIFGNGGRPYAYVENGDQLRKLALTASEANQRDRGISIVSSVRYERDRRIRAWALARAGGVCELCANDAPFKLANGEPFLEVHHIKSLSESGFDTLLNVAALCPNCHRKSHFSGNRESIERVLIFRVNRSEEAYGGQAG